MRALALLLLVAAGCAPAVTEPAPDLAVSKAQFWGGWSGGGGSGGASTGSANTWTASQTFNVTNGQGAVIVSGQDLLCLNAGCTTSLYENSSSTVYLNVASAGVANFNGSTGLATFGYDVLATRGLRTGSQDLTSGTYTCNAGNHGLIIRDTLTGDASDGKRTKLCLCTSDGAASPAYAWQNLATGTVGTTTTCGTE